MGDIPQRVSNTGVLTTVNLVIIVLLAAVVIGGIAYGMRLKRQRADADRIERDRVEAEGGHVPSRQEAAQPLDESVLSRDAAAAPSIAPAPAPEPERATPASPPAPPPVEATPDEPRQPDVAADEPVPAAAPLDASPATEAEPVPATAPPAAPSQAHAPVGRIKGIGPKVATLLAERGITTVGDVAALDPRAAEDLDAHLGAFTGRMTRDRWLEQARLLAAGDLATYEQRFGKL